MARRCAGKAYADALELLYVAEPGAAHRIEELMLYRDGKLETGKRIELERHLEGCTGCKRTLRTIALVEESTQAFLLLPVSEFDFSRFLPGAPKGRSRVGKIIGIGAGVLAAAVAVAWWLGQSKVAEVPVPLPPPQPVLRPPRPLRLMAPKRIEKADAGPTPDAGADE
jgi:hypothetical protein